MELKDYINKVNKRRQPSYHIVNVKIKPQINKLHGIKALLCDIYGTILTSRASSIGDLEKDKEILNAFNKTIKEFGFENSLKKINPNKNTIELLKEIYIKEIKKVHKIKMIKSIKNPEVRIELIWKKIIGKLIKNGYKYNKRFFGNLLDFSFKVSYFYKYVSEKNKLYKNVLTTLKKLKQKGILLGLASNAQFYTPINLEMEFRKNSNGKVGLYDLFKKNLISFSYKAGESKPSKKIFKRVLENLRKKGIKTNQIAYLGNDLNSDIKIAKELGLKTILFAGDENSLKMNARVKPSATITNWVHLLKMIK